MINIKNAVPTAIFAAAVAATAVYEKISDYRESKKTPAEKVTVKVTSLAEFNAFDEAQTILTDRMLAGYYDDKTDAEYQHDFEVVYANFLNK